MDAGINSRTEDAKRPRFGKLSENFHSDEFRCGHGKCPYCGGSLHAEGVPPDLVDLLEDIRANFGGNPIEINSGYRCKAHNDAVGGEPNSYHMRGLAADIKVAGVDPGDVHMYADKINPQGGVGRYKTFTHVDVRGYKARWNG